MQPSITTFTASGVWTIRVCEYRQLKVPMHLTSKRPFIWVYNQTLPTKPNLSKSRVAFPNVRVPFPNIESPFIWVYNQTLPTKPSLRAYSQRPSAYSQPKGKGLLHGHLMSSFLKSLWTSDVNIRGASSERQWIVLLNWAENTIL